MNLNRKLVAVAAVVLVGLVGWIVVTGEDDAEADQERTAAIGTTAKYPDTDIIIMKATGGFVGGVSYGASAITFSSNKAYQRNLYLEDGARNGQCMSLYELIVPASGPVPTTFTKLRSLCDYQGTRIYEANTTTTVISAVKLKLCQLTSTGAYDNDACVVSIVKPGID